MMVFVLLSRMFRRAVMAVAATVLPLKQLSVIAAMVPVRFQSSTSISNLRHLLVSLAMLT